MSSPAGRGFIRFPAKNPTKFQNLTDQMKKPPAARRWLLIFHVNALLRIILSYAGIDAFSIPNS